MTEIACLVDSKNKLGEVPVWDVDEQALYWVDIENKLLQRYAPATGDVRRWTLPERIGSFALRSSGGFVCALASGFAFFDPDSGQIEWINKPEAGIPRNRFNDGKCDRKGRFWAGTMDDRLEEHTGALYRLDGDRSVHRLIGSIGISNSLAWSPDNRHFYFADTMDRAIYLFDYDHETGAIGDKRLFASTENDPGNPDGSTIDAEGFLWNAQWDGWRLVRYAPDGRVDRVVHLPVQKPTSCMFGGPDLRTLYVTSAVWDLDDDALRKQPWAGGLLALDVGVAGLPEPRFDG
jgi:sugar lactone lactonase YvrE